MKTQGSLPGEEAALVLLFSLVASGQIKLRKLDGFRRIAAVLSLRCSGQREERGTCYMSRSGTGDARIKFPNRATEHEEMHRCA